MANIPVVIKRGYINIYSELRPKELRQIHYKTRYKAVDNLWDESMVYLSKKFAELVPHNSTILDAGCGNGNYIVDENREHIKEAIGVDTKPEYAKKNISMDKIIYANLEDIPLADNSIDAIISLWVMEHLKNPQQAFQEFHRILKPGGMFLFVAPNKNFIPLRLMSLIKSGNINRLLNKILFDRDADDIFTAYYRANTLKAIKEHLHNLFEEVELRLNYDPAYTSFNSLTFHISNYLDKFLKVPGTKAHIIGIYKKEA